MISYNFLKINDLLCQIDTRELSVLILKQRNPILNKIVCKLKLAEIDSRRGWGSSLFLLLHWFPNKKALLEGYLWGPLQFSQLTQPASAYSTLIALDDLDHFMCHCNCVCIKFVLSPGKGSCCFCLHSSLDSSSVFWE